MNEIHEFLINSYNGANDEEKESIRILLRKEVVLRCKCSVCGHKFDPQDEENMKLSRTIFD
jgi:hypothetical protein